MEGLKVDTQEIKPMVKFQSLADAFRKRMGENLELNDEQKRRIKGWLKKRIQEWLEDTQELHQRLMDDNDLYEGILVENDPIYEGAFDVHVPVAELYTDIYRSILRRSILGADRIWIAEIDPDLIGTGVEDEVSNIEENINYRCRNEWNIEQTIDEAILTTTRDGVTGVQVTYAEEYERSRDIVLLTDLKDFLSEFPGAEESGMSEEEWLELAKQVNDEASPDFPLEVPIEFDKQCYSGCKGDIVEFSNLVTIPTSVPHIRHELCRGYGKRYQTTKDYIKKKMKDEVFFKEACNKVTKNKGNSQTNNEILTAKDDIDGISSANTENKYELFELVIKGKLDGEDGDEKKYLVTYSYDHDELLQIIDYPYRIDYYALLRINKRPGRLASRGVPAKTREMNYEVDQQHNMRIRTREISSIPSFKGKKNAKRDFDPDHPDNRWKPGVIFWLDDPDAFEQFKVQPTDLGESMAEESNDFKILDMYLGSPAALLSGGVPQGDPNAPGNKTAMLIGQSNMRMDEPLAELRQGIEEIGEIVMSHMYQFGPPTYEFMSQAEEAGIVQPIKKTVQKKYMRRGIRMKMSGITVIMNPEAEFQKKMLVFQTLSANPEFVQNPELRFKVMQDALRALGEPKRKEYLPSTQELKQYAVEIQKQAILQMQQEKMKQEREAKKKRLQDARDEVGIRNVSTKLAENGVNLPGVQNGAVQPAPTQS